MIRCGLTDNRRNDADTRIAASPTFDRARNKSSLLMTIIQMGSLCGCDLTGTCHLGDLIPIFRRNYEDGSWRISGYKL